MRGNNFVGAPVILEPGSRVDLRMENNWFSDTPHALNNQGTGPVVAKKNRHNADRDTPDG